jgi:hypothetical protein
LLLKYDKGGSVWICYTAASKIQDIYTIWNKIRLRRGRSGDTVEEVADSTEGPTAKLLGPTYSHSNVLALRKRGQPVEHHRITTLNINQYDVSAPKPDTHFGYPTNQRSGWSYAQSNVITHPMARPYAQPARGNTFPFLKVEMKSEAADGTIYATENQAAGSGSHSVCSVMASSRSRCPYHSLLTNTIAFTIAMPHREAGAETDSPGKIR